MKVFVVIQLGIYQNLNSKRLKIVLVYNLKKICLTNCLKVNCELLNFTILIVIVYPLYDSNVASII